MLLRKVVLAFAREWKWKAKEYELIDDRLVVPSKPQKDLFLGAKYYKRPKKTFQKTISSVSMIATQLKRTIDEANLETHRRRKTPLPMPRRARNSKDPFADARPPRLPQDPFAQVGSQMSGGSQDPFAQATQDYDRQTAQTMLPEPADSESYQQTQQSTAEEDDVSEGTSAGIDWGNAMETS